MNEQSSLVRWNDVGRPGYLGKHREEKYAKWNQEYGKGNWRIVWVNGNDILDFLQACHLYEHSYFAFLKGNQRIVEELTIEASDVYDDSPSNIKSGRDYTIQETNRTHIQDIAIRNAMDMLGVQFSGEKLIQIRDKEGMHPLSMTLSPGRVPFFYASIIVQPELKGWWNPGSVESFYQSNRMLQKRVV